MDPPNALPGPLEEVSAYTIALNVCWSCPNYVTNCWNCWNLFSELRELLELFFRIIRIIGIILPIYFPV